MLLLHTPKYELLLPVRARLGQEDHRINAEFGQK